MLHPSYTDLMKVVNKDVRGRRDKGSQQPILYRDGNSKKSQTDHRWCLCR